MSRGRFIAKHGMRSTPEYQVWCDMKRRCYHVGSQQYKNYGARGIAVCERWLNSFPAFFADMGPRPVGTTIDRYPDNDGNYEPSNCRWATAQAQRRNQRNTRLTPTLIRVLCRLKEFGLSYPAISDACRVPETTAYNAINGITWPDIALIRQEQK